MLLVRKLLSVAVLIAIPITILFEETWLITAPLVLILHLIRPKFIEHDKKHKHLFGISTIIAIAWAITVGSYMPADILLTSLRKPLSMVLMIAFTIVIGVDAYFDFRIKAGSQVSTFDKID